ncbi:MAG: hypothetical protein Q8P20_08170 [bacterium]|nr:hypothetical protein [bacterium]
MKLYTTGEIFRQGLLKNHKGDSYSDRVTVSKIVKKMNYHVKQTPFGPANCLTEDQINEHNKKWLGMK